MTSSLNEEITGEYYKTTAARGHLPSREQYENNAAGLKRRFQSWLPANRQSDCLDLACGCGDMLYCLEREGFTHTAGVDLCAEELEQARPFVRAQLSHADVLEYLRQTASTSLDFVTAINFLEHLSKDKLLEVLREVRRILRPGGSLVAMTPNAISPFGGLTRHWDLTHEWAFTPNNFRQLAALTGFEPQIEFRECGPVVHGFISGIRYLLWQFLRAGIAAWFLIELAETKGGVYTMDMLVRMRVK
jgi:SAM-dependent methyltransferase